VSSFDLLVVGDVNADLVLRGGDLVPAFGQREQLVDEASLVLGGSGAIVAAGAARLGLRVAMAGCVGDDALGRAMLESLDGVDVSAVRTVAEPTGVSVGLARPGDRAVLTALGALAAFRAEDVPAALLASARWVHVASPFLQPALDVAAIAARAAGTTSLDPGWDPREEWRLAWEGFDVLLPNAQEAQRLVGENDPEAAALALASRGPLVVVKMGAEGALAVGGQPRAEGVAAGGKPGAEGAVPADREPGAEGVAAGAEELRLGGAHDGFLRVRGPRVDPVDATGAGDSFDAGFLTARLAGEGLAEALALGCACGALSTRAAGGTEGQPTLAEAQSFRV
jgi:sugar/nucleoside kinase (ribokinase family)